MNLQQQYNQETRDRALEKLVNQPGYKTAVNKALRSAQDELREEEASKAYDLDLIERELAEYNRKNGTYPGDGVRKLLAAARHYQQLSTINQ